MADITPKTSKNKLHRLKYSCEEIYERMDNGLCIFCDELDTPGHHKLKHNGVRIFMVECGDDRVSNDNKEAHQVHESAKNSDSFIKPTVETDSSRKSSEFVPLLQDYVELNRKEDHPNTVAERKLNLHLGQSIEHLVCDENLVYDENIKYVLASGLQPPPVAIPIEEDAVNLGFENEVESVVDGKQLLEAYDDLATQVLVNVTGKVSVVIDDYDDTVFEMLNTMPYHKELLRIRKRKQKRSKSWRFKFKGKAHKSSVRTILLLKNGVMIFVTSLTVISLPLVEDNQFFLDGNAKDDIALLEKFGSIDSYHKACLLLEWKYVEFVGGKTHGDELLVAGQKVHANQDFFVELHITIPVRDKLCSKKKRKCGGKFIFTEKSRTDYIDEEDYAQVQSGEKQRKSHKTWKFKYKPEFMLKITNQIHSLTRRGSIKCKMKMMRKWSLRQLDIRIQIEKFNLAFQDGHTHHRRVTILKQWFLQVVFQQSKQETGKLLFLQRATILGDGTVRNLLFGTNLCLLRTEVTRDAHMLLLEYVVKWKQRGRTTVIVAGNKRLMDIKDGINKAAMIWGINFCKANVLRIIRYKLLWNRKISMRVYEEDLWLFMRIILKIEMLLQEHCWFVLTFGLSNGLNIAVVAAFFTQSCLQSRGQVKISLVIGFQRMEKLSPSTIHADHSLVILSFDGDIMKFRDIMSKVLSPTEFERESETLKQIFNRLKKLTTAIDVSQRYMDLVYKLQDTPHDIFIDRDPMFLKELFHVDGDGNVMKLRATGFHITSLWFYGSLPRPPDFRESLYADIEKNRKRGEGFFVSAPPRLLLDVSNVKEHEFIFDKKRNCHNKAFTKVFVHWKEQPPDQNFTKISSPSRRHVILEDKDVLKRRVLLQGFTIPLSISFHIPFVLQEELFNIPV